MTDKVVLNSYKFYELAKKPTLGEITEYYRDTYYQEAKGSYEKKYTEAEITYFKNKLDQKYALIKELISINEVDRPKFLDIGCGEGWSLDFFHNQNWDVTGVDFSSYGCESFNPDMKKYLIEGDLHVEIEKLIQAGKKFDCIYMINVLEHVLEPMDILKQCNQLLSEKGVLMIQVPNDFSSLQEYLMNKDKIDRAYWVAAPDHISYFNAQGLKNICCEAGFCELKILGDFPVEFNLFNENTNYIMDESKGKSCHKGRVDIENFLHGISKDKVNQLYEMLGGLGLGRVMIGLFRKKSPDL